jgi:hypothetical protein
MFDATPLLRRYAKHRLARLAVQDTLASQRATLRHLLRRAAGTRFGREYGFAEISDPAGFQRAVKLRGWEEFWQDWWQPDFPLLTNVTWPGRIGRFALTSGTTGATTKRIPVSHDMLRANRRAALDVLCWHLVAHPNSRLFAGRNFMLGGSTSLASLAPGIAEGDLSGIAAADIPWWARSHAWPPNDIALLGDWERKLALLVERTPMESITSLSGTPSWLLLFFDLLAARHPDQPRRLAALFPNLELVVHGGVGFAPYESRFASWLEGSRIALREVYAASEGFFAVADRGPNQGLRLILDNGLFYEFIRPAQLDAAMPDRRWIGDAEAGVEYAMVVSSNAGLWSFVVGDTVVLDPATPQAPRRLRISGRTSWSLSVFGEHLIGSELDEAVARAARGLGVMVADYSVGGVFPDADSGRGGHLFLIELDEPGAAENLPARFSNLLDEALCQLNADYAAHRQGGFGMLAPEVRLLRSGSFTDWMRRRHRLGGQNKVPRVIADPAMLADLAGESGTLVFRP